MVKVIKNGEAAISTLTKPSNDATGMVPGTKDGRFLAATRAIYFNDRRLQTVLLILMLLWYSALLAISWRLARTDPVRLTFNSMLDHMLHGRFDVAPDVVQVEGFARNGRVYSYFGAWCALLRLPLWFIHRMNLDITFWSCLAAVCLASMAKVRAVLLVRQRAIQSVAVQWALGLMLGYVVLAGSAIAYLIDDIYNEVLLWAYAFAAVFVYFALKGIVDRNFDSHSLNCMALCAGLALLTRVSTGVGLILAFLLVIFALVLGPGTPDAEEKLPAIRRHGRSFSQPYRFVPLAILAVFIAATGAVNYFRWGNPTTFANYDLYLVGQSWPNFLSNLHAYGVFNFKRIPFAFIYYFLPVWVLHGPDGRLLFEGTQARLFGDIELPPGTFLLTDLLPLCFIFLLGLSVRRRCHTAGLSPAGTRSIAIATGLLVPCVFMLSLAWLIDRYRLEFYPEIEFLAFLGLYLTVTDEAILATFARFKRCLTIGLMVSVLASMMALVLCNLSGDGPPQELLRPGIVRYYYSQAVLHYRHEVARHLSSHLQAH